MSITLTARKARPAIGLILLTMSLGVLIAQIDTCGGQTDRHGFEGRRVIRQGL